jgi:hypothetical protein
MTEWSVYLVTVSLMATAIMIAKPVSALTRTNTKLECAVEKLSEAMCRIEQRTAGIESRVEAHSGAIEQHKIEIKNIKVKGRRKSV